jgi:hypothetical protein
MSHFSFTRSTYDDCALQKKAQESTDPYKWSTDATVVENNESCYLGASPFMHNPFHSVPVNSIDIESELRGQTRLLSKCQENKFNPNANKPVNVDLKPCADERLVPEYTRVDKPCNMFSGVSINRFHPLCEDLQALTKIHSNTYTGTNTRLQVKDAYKKENPR